MKTLRKILLVSLTIVIVFANQSASAQTNFVCAWKTIQEKVEATNEGKFNQQKIVEELGEVDFLKQQKFETDGPCQKVYTSLAEFIDEAGTALTELGMVGYVRLSACLIKIQDDTIPHLKAAFTKGGNFKGADFDAVMKKLADDDRFDFDPTTRTFTSKDSGLKWQAESYQQGEKHSITHVFRGHADNDFAPTKPVTSIFDDPDEIFEIADDAWKKIQNGDPGVQPYGNQGNGWIVDVGRTVGKNSNNVATTHVRIFVNSGGVMRTIFPN